MYLCLCVCASVRFCSTSITGSHSWGPHCSCGRMTCWIWTKQKTTVWADRFPAYDLTLRGTALCYRANNSSRIHSYSRPIRRWLNGTCRHFSARFPSIFYLRYRRGWLQRIIGFYRPTFHLCVLWQTSLTAECMWAVPRHQHPSHLVRRRVSNKHWELF